MSFALDMKGDLLTYEEAKRGKLPPVTDLESLGRALVLLRIASGLTQQQLASKLGVTQPQVSRDENEEYHAISMDRAQRILAALGARLEGKLIMAGPGQAEPPVRHSKAA